MSNSTNEPKEESKELAVRAGKGVSGTVAGLLGLAAATTTGDPIAIGASVAQIARAGVGRIDDWQTEKRQRRMEQLLNGLDKRVSKIEDDAIGSQERVDLFMEILHNAANETDAAKIEFQVAFVAWYLEEKPTVALVRLLGSAIQQLTYFELVAFVSWMETNQGPAIMDYQSTSLFWNRIQNAGLFGGGSVRSQSNATDIGLIAARIFKHMSFGNNTTPPPE